MMAWYNQKELPARAYFCAFCNFSVSSSAGWHNTVSESIYVCSRCGNPSFFDHAGRQFPTAVFGAQVPNLPDAVRDIYDEARQCTGASAYTGAVLLCRKLLMNIAVSHGAEAGGTFASYVDYLASKGYVPPNGKEWVDHIRKKGNDATHEIEVMKKEDAEDLIRFAEMLLRFNFEFPSLLASKKK